MTEGNQSASAAESAGNGTTGEGQEQSGEEQNGSFLGETLNKSGEEGKENQDGEEIQKPSENKEGQEAFDPKYTDQFPDHLKKNEKLTQFIKDNKLEKIGDFGEKVLELLEASDGAIKKPGDNATDEEWAAFRIAMGIPETAEQYNLENITVPEGLPVDADVMTKKAHELNLSQQQLEDMANALFENIDKNYQEGFETLQSERKGITQELTDLWGSDFDVNMQKVGQMTRVVGALLIKDGMFKDYDQFKKYIDSGIGDDRAFIRLMKIFNDHLGEDSIGELGNLSGPSLRRDNAGRLEPQFPKSFPDSK